MRSLKTWTAAAAMVMLTGAAQAALVDRGGGMIYDTTLDITWLADLNYAGTSGADYGGLMMWANAVAWADNLTYARYTDWRLPTLNRFDTTCSEHRDLGGGLPLEYYGFNCTGGELSHLFVADLGYNNDGQGLITSDDTTVQINNLALFSNVQSTRYWSGTPDTTDPYDPDDRAWNFYSDRGLQNTVGAYADGLAIAVRSGDVAALVPEPQTLALALLALGAAAVARKRRPA